MKALLISSIAFLGSILLGWAILCHFHPGESNPDEVIKPISVLGNQRIRLPENKEVFRAMFGEKKGEIALDGIAPEREEKANPPSKFVENEKSRREFPPAAVHPILASAGIPMRDITLQSKEEIDHFVEKLSELFKRRDTDDGSGQAQEIFFSTLVPDLKTGVSVPIEYFSPASIRIFAVFATDREIFRDLGHVLVKWFNPQGSEDMFQYLPITPNANYNYIWRELPYWEPGIYNVEVYRVSVGQDLKVMASGSFHVQDLKEYFSYAALYRDLNQSISQMDFLQGDPIYLKLNFSSQGNHKLTLALRDFHNGNPFSFRDMALSPASPSSVYLLKGPSESLARGMFWLELSTEDGLLVGRTKFGVH